MICSIHDVAFPEGGSCWCCDLAQRGQGSEPGKTDAIAAPISSNRVDAPLPPRQISESGNLHCGKHDTIYTAEAPCRGCEMERAGAILARGDHQPDDIKGPDDTLAEFRTNMREAQATADSQEQHIWPKWFRDWLKDFRP